MYKFHRLEIRLPEAEEDGGGGRRGENITKLRRSFYRRTVIEECGAVTGCISVIEISLEILKYLLFICNYT